MGIDRENIPDEYLCELCQPRTVDKTRARSLQLSKRKEQAILMNAQLNAGTIGTGSTIPNGGVVLHTDITGQLVSSTQLPDGKVTLAVVPQIGGKKGKAKKNDLVNKKGTINAVKKERPVVKRKETKRITKRKTKNTGTSSDLKNTDKHADNLKQWIENYEIAVTNHYSPELRARLHAITKQQNLLQSIMAQENKWLKNCQNMESKGTTVPHAGGKILISNFDILPNSAIVELRGKYMLTTQFKTQNPSINMNTPPPTPPAIPNLKNNKIPGPFIFFFHLPVDSNLVGGLVGLSSEVCVDTRTYGNEARFVRRSCRPNAELQYSFEKGTIHLYIVSLSNIMASTEITIKHEPHDLSALENKFFTNIGMSPTSTVCACGLTKECAFGVQPMGVPQHAQPTEALAVETILSSPATIITKTTKAARKSTTLNGSVPEKKSKKNSNVSSRGRSTSSSGESNGLLSPNINTNFIQNMYSTASISSILHDSGIYTSSSSPSVSIPSPVHVQPTISSPPLQQQLPQIKQTTATITPIVSVQQSVIPIGTLAPPSPIEIIPKTEIVEVVPPPVEEVPAEELPVEETQKIVVTTTDSSITTSVPLCPPTEILPLEIVTEPQEQSLLNTATDVAIIQSPKDEEENPQEPETIPDAPVNKAGPQKQQPPPSSPTPSQQTPVQSLKRTPSKSRTTSSSEDTQSATTPTPTAEPKTEVNKRDSRKLTREERKMEAIVRAFEKMEKNQQRKNEPIMSLNQNQPPGNPTG